MPSKVTNAPFTVNVTTKCRSIDSDVLIWHLRGERKALNLLKRLRDNEQFDLWIGAMQHADVVFFMRPDKESDIFRDICTVVTINPQIKFNIVRDDLSDPVKKRGPQLIFDRERYNYYRTKTLKRFAPGS